MQIVADEQDGEPELAAQVGEEVHHLRLDRHVERRDRLVRDDEIRSGGERPGDRDTLTLPAGELVREAARLVWTQPDLREQRPDVRRA
ncbi:hypothetical protein [Methylobacterium crusticola]|uniref:hypothetical protein n=1 Tax=Methylobacterium crusticola TaxID=1697972 RepID=UPI001939BFB4|nr:hypothetical protein [Methylobacterium crusticola]